MAILLIFISLLLFIALVLGTFQYQKLKKIEDKIIIVSRGGVSQQSTNIQLTAEINLKNGKPDLNTLNFSRK